MPYQIQVQPCKYSVSCSGYKRMSAPPTPHPNADHRVDQAHPGFFTPRVILKALLLFLLINLVFVLVYPLDAVGGLSVYNRLVPGRVRLPYGDDPSRAYTLSLFSLEAMFSSHEIDAVPKAADEYRVLLIGDSSTWGYLLPPGQTLAAYLNQTTLTLPDNRHVRAYNLGYPVMSLTKDLLLLSQGMRYQPDMVIWLVTLESFPLDKQLYPPLLLHNPEAVRELIAEYDLPLDTNDPGFINAGPLGRTIIGSRRTLADWLRLQFYGMLWAATGIDQYIPASFTPRMEDLPPDENFHELEPPHLNFDQLAIDVLQAGQQAVGQVPLVIINEPMFISQGENSHIRYNYYYPRWAYDDYRLLMAESSAANGWRYLDLWDAIPASEFTNSAVHMSSSGTAQLADLLCEVILANAVDLP